MSMPVLSLRVSALSRALSSLTDTVMDSLSVHPTNGSSSSASGRRHGVAQSSESDMTKIMAAVTRSELELEERIRAVLCDELGRSEKRAEERSLASDMSVRERVVHLEEEIAALERRIQDRMERLEEHLRACAISNANNAAAVTKAASGDHQTHTMNAVRELSNALESVRMRMNAIENQSATQSRSVGRLQQQQQHATTACEALAKDVSSLADESRAIREGARLADRLNKEHFETLLMKIEGLHTRNSGADVESESVRTEDIVTALRKLIQENSTLSRRVEVLELALSRQ